MSLTDRYVDELGAALRGGQSLGDAMRDLTIRHAAELRAMGPVQVLALDPCPRCAGNVIASEVEARCAAGCGWTYRRAA